MIKAIIFDCFGVLYPQATGNFFERHKPAFNDNLSTLDKINLEIDSGQIIRVDFFKKLEEITGIPADKIRNEIDSQLVASQELIMLIKKLKQNYKIGLLSNAGREEIEILYKDRLENLFDSMTVSYEAGMTKPNPEIFLLSAQRLRVEPHECIFVDDSMTNIEIAKKIKMETILYNNFDGFKKDLTLKFNKITKNRGL